MNIAVLVDGAMAKLMLNNFLLPTDGSEGTLHAAAILARLVEHDAGVRVTVACVDAEAAPMEEELDMNIIEPRNNPAHRDAEDAVNRTLSVLDGHGIRCVGKVIFGDPISATILKQAMRGKHDAIAIAVSDRPAKRNQRQPLGCVTAHVLRQANIPVIVLPVREEK